MRVADALVRARALGVERLDAQLLLSRRLQQPRSWLIAHDDHVLAWADEQAIEQQLQQRAAGVPLAYLLGEREFRGLMLQVTPAVLVPRPETEHLVEWALECVAGVASPRVIDLGTGSGAIAIAVAHARPDARVCATDVDPAALAVAQDNARRHGLAIAFVRSDWWSSVDEGPFDLVLSNPPYIAGDDPHLPALAHEPRHALTPEGDGLAALRAIINGAITRLKPGGWLLLEHGHDQGQAVRELLTQAGLVDVSTRPDLAGLDRCSGGRQQAADARADMSFAV